jgi:hypothetical protein
MTTSNPISSPDVREHLEEDAALAGEVAAGGLRAFEVAIIVLLGLLLCPPLAILVFLVVAPLLVLAVVLGLLVAIVTAPYLLFHHLRGHGGGHAPLLRQRLRHAGRALIDLLPHRIVADARLSERRRSA